MSDWPFPRIIAHRGGGCFAPENTLAAIRTGHSLGAAGVEFDVMLAGDGVPVLMHDESLERTTNGRGKVAETPYPALARLDAGTWFSPAFAGEPVPGYADAVKLCLESGLWANVEIKPGAGLEAQTGRAVALASARLWRGAPLGPVLSSFSVEALAAALQAAPDLRRGYLTKSIGADWRETTQRLQCASLHCDWRQLTEPLARAVRDSGCALLCYTVNEPEAARRLFGWGVDAIFTDRLDLIGPDFS